MTQPAHGYPNSQQAYKLQSMFGWIFFRDKHFADNTFLLANGRILINNLTVKQTDTLDINSQRFREVEVVKDKKALSHEEQFAKEHFKRHTVRTTGNHITL
jgi:hypothetical protein